MSDQMGLVHWVDHSTGDQRQMFGRLDIVRDTEADLRAIEIGDWGSVKFTITTQAEVIPNSVLALLFGDKPEPVEPPYPDPEEEQGEHARDLPYP